MRAQLALVLIARALAQFPAVEDMYGTLQPLPREQRVAPERARGQHSFYAEGDGWRCTGCHRYRAKGSPDLTEQCLPLACGARRAIEVAPPLGHSLWATRPVGSCGLGIVFCMKCGRFAAGRLLKLAQPCPLRPSRHGGRLALARLARSPPMHPDDRGKLPASSPGRLSAASTEDLSIRFLKILCLSRGSLERLSRTARDGRNSRAKKLPRR